MNNIMGWMFTKLPSPLRRLFGTPPPAPSQPPLPGPAQLLAGLPDTAQGRALADQIRWAEAAYDEMYEGRSPSGAYSEMKACMHEAIRIARELGLNEKTAQLERVLEHRQAVFRGQMR